MSVRIINQDVRDALPTLEAGSVQLCLTSPPYLGLRSYGTAPQIWGGASDCRHEWGLIPSTGHRGSDTNPGPLQRAGANTERDQLIGGLCRHCGAWRGELGSEPTVQMFTEHLVEIFEGVRHALRDDGCLVVNLADSYANDAKWGGSSGGKHVSALHGQSGIGRQKRQTGIPAKSLMMVPFRFALAMQDAGWILRSVIPWVKRNPMPESVTDRPATAIEYLFLFSKKSRYFWDGEAIRVPQSANTHARYGEGKAPRRPSVPKQVTPGLGIKSNESFYAATADAVLPNGRAYRNSDAFFQSWQGLLLNEHDDPLALVVNPAALKEAHFASFPAKLVEPFVRAGTSEKGACPSCGAPWRRLTSVDREGLPVRGQHESWSDDEFRNGQPRQRGHRGTPRVSTLDWQPSCPCPPADPVPCVVLDPFFGSGTTGLVSDQLGRDCIGVELNPAYADMARRRIERDAGPMFGDVVTVHEAGEQLALLGPVAGGEVAS